MNPNPNDDVDNTCSVGELSEEEKPFFFGIYASNPSNFVFLRGERKMIKALVDHVNSIETAHTKLEHFQLNVNGRDKIKISWEGTFQLNIGMYFGKKTLCATKKKVTTKNSTEDLKKDLFDKFQKFHRQYYDSVSSEISENLIEITIVSDNIIKAKVSCIFCYKLKKSKKVTIHCKMSKSSLCWVFSNLKRHMDKHVEDNDLKNVERDAQEVSAPTRPTDFEEAEAEAGQSVNEEESESENATQDDDDRESLYMDSIFTQLSVQNLKMQNAIVLHTEIKQNFSFNLGDNVYGVINVTDIKKDGNCMFGALAHQLFYVKLNSVEHDNATKELRMKSADHIRENYDLFAHNIKGRVFDRNVNVVDINKESIFFVNFCLPQPGCWGGFESLKAISYVYKINIFIFNENGDYYFANGFNPSHDRSVFIAFRNANQIKNHAAADRNHYDSVVEINSEILSECSRKSAEKLVKTECETISQNIISLD